LGRAVRDRKAQRRLTAHSQLARDVAHVDRALQRALHALGDDLAQLRADLLAEVLHPRAHPLISTTATARHRSSRFRKVLARKPVRIAPFGWAYS